MSKNRKSETENPSISLKISDNDPRRIAELKAFVDSIPDVDAKYIETEYKYIVYKGEMNSNRRSDQIAESAAETANPSAAFNAPVSGDHAAKSEPLASSHKKGGQPTTFNLPAGDMGKKVGVTLSTEDFSKLEDFAKAAGHSSPTTFARYLLHQCLNSQCPRAK